MSRPIAIALLLTGVLAAGETGVAQARSSPHVMTGHWGGFARSADTDIRGPMSLDVAEQSGSRFTGEVCGLVPTSCISVVGAVDDSGNATMFGSTEEIRMEIETIVIESVMETGERKSMLEGRYRTESRDGRRARGTVLAVHQTDDVGAPSFAGTWTGSVKPRDRTKWPISAAFAQTSAGALRGQIVVELPETGRSSFDVVGQSLGEGGNGDGIVVGQGDNHDLKLVMHNDPGQKQGYVFGLISASPPSPEGFKWSAGTTTLTRQNSGECIDDNAEPNDDVGHATATVIGVTRTGRICGSNDDYYAVTGASDRKTRIVLNFDHPTGDLDLVLYNAALAPVAKSDGTANEEIIELNLPVGTHYLKVFGYNGARGPYSLLVTRTGGRAAPAP